MSESNYNEVFEAIKSNLVPKIQYEKSQLEVVNLKEIVRKLNANKSDQMNRIMILMAEKESLKAERKTFEVKVKEVSLKLKQKTYQYLSLLNQSQKNALNASQNKVCVTEKISTGSQTIKEEPPEIGVVNVPASCSSSKASKRTHSKTFSIKEKESTSKKTLNKSAKRCMVEKSAEESAEESSLDHSLEVDSDSYFDSEEEQVFLIEDIKDVRVKR